MGIAAVRYFSEDGVPILPFRSTMRRLRPLLRILCTCAALAVATDVQALDPHKSIAQYVRHAWETDDGLPQNSISGIAQTDDGFLWIGTRDGLARFDGARFTVYNRENTPAMR